MLVSLYFHLLAQGCIRLVMSRQAHLHKLSHASLSEHAELPRARIRPASSQTTGKQ